MEAFLEAILSCWSGRRRRLRGLVSSAVCPASSASSAEIEAGAEALFELLSTWAEEVLELLVSKAADTDKVRTLLERLDPSILPEVLVTRRHRKHVVRLLLRAELLPRDWKLYVGRNIEPLLVSLGSDPQLESILREDFELLPTTPRLLF